MPHFEPIIKVIPGTKECYVSDPVDGYVALTLFDRLRYWYHA
jgi:hypothetical protein